MRYPCEKTQRAEKICKTFRKISRKGVDKVTKKCYNNQVPRDRTNLGVAQLVARYLGVVEAASSSLVTQTRKREMSNLPFFQFLWDFFEA